MSDTGDGGFADPVGSSPSVGMLDLGVRLAVLEADQATRSRLVMQLGDDVAGHGSVIDLADQLDGEPTIVVMGPSCAQAADFAGADRVLQQYPELGAVLVADELTTELFQRSMRSGVRDVLAAPVDTAQLIEAVRRVAGTLDVGRPGAVTTGADDEELGQVITVFSTKGGAGKSVVACNLGVTLAKRSDKPVALVDADLQFGDVAVMLKLAPQHTIVDAVQSMDRLDTGYVSNLLSRHQYSGLRVLPAPLEPAAADQITAESVSTIVSMLRQMCSYVIIDTPSYFDDRVLNLIEESDDIVLVAGMDIPNIKNVKIGLQTMRLLNTPMSKVHLVLNRANSKVRLDVGEVERTLQVKAECLVPSDIAVPQSVNKGNPVVFDAPKSGVAKSLGELADLFTEQPARADRKR